MVVVVAGSIVVDVVVGNNGSVLVVMIGVVVVVVTMIGANVVDVVVVKARVVDVVVNATDVGLPQSQHSSLLLAPSAVARVKLPGCSTMFCT